MPSSLVKKCSCDARADCIHTVTLSSSSFSKVYQYTQCSFTQDIYTVDNDGNGVDVSVSIIKKNKQSACLPHCGSGVIFNDFGDGFYNPLNEGMNNVTLEYRGKESVPSAIEFINAIVLADKFAIKPSDYRLQVFECAGRFENERLFYSQSGVVYNNTSGGLNVVDTVIHVYPKAEFELSLNFSYEGHSSTYTDEERKEKRREYNSNKNAAKRKNTRNLHKGWTIYTPKFKQENEFKIEGEASFSFGDKNKKYTKDLFSRKNTNDKNKLNIIDKGFDAIHQFSSMFSSGKGKFNLIETIIKPPAIGLSGSGEINPNNEQYNIEKRLKVKLEPLIGVSLTLDLIQALAAYFKIDSLVSSAREKISCDDNSLNCADLRCDLIAETKINTEFEVTSKNDVKDITMSGKTSGEIALNLDSNLATHYEVLNVNGFFEIGADIKAKAIYEFSRVGDKLVLIFYHDGVEADVVMKYKFNVNKANSSSKKKSIGSPNVSSSVKKWVLYDKLPKEKSKYKIEI
ncbi:hypothetical protein [Photobacterium damselae]|uniref:hypothetical protein n=1 Tax=Photobacterium damselae TaxID=38293 RepID=UPI00406964F6